jgi:hypothetical protein
MRVDGLQVALRSRSPWEATDLGVALARRHYGRIQRAFWAFGLPLFALLNALAYAIDQVWLAGLLLWWLKPWFDQLVLHVLSRAVFTDPPRTRDTLRQQFRLGAVWPWLLWRRIDLARGLSLPVAVLEGLRGADRRQRSALLGRASNSAVAIGLCLVLLHVEIAIWLSVFALALMFVPYDFLGESAQILFETLMEDPPRWAQVLLNFVSLFAMAVVEPFFVGAGFALYLNRRTQLEAWDIELAFRRIARRIAALALMLMVALAPALLPTAVLATPATDDAAAVEDEDEASADEAEWQAEIVASPKLAEVFPAREADHAFAREVAKTLEAEVFGEKRMLQRWERIDEAVQQPRSTWSPLVRVISAVFGFIAEFGLWILLALLVAVALMHAARWRLPLLERLRPRSSAAAPVVEADRAPETLPTDLIAAARVLFAQGKPRAAMALLYRGACALLPDRYGQVLTPGATEAEVMRLARRVEDAGARDALVEVVRHWQRAAYADDLPDTTRFETLVARCDAAGWGMR